jgi:hypothetical protein
LILSKSETTPAYLSAFPFFFCQTGRYCLSLKSETFFHILASSPDIVPNVYQTVVEDLLLLQRDVDQMRHEVGSVIEKITEMNIGRNSSESFRSTVADST